MRLPVLLLSLVAADAAARGGFVKRKLRGDDARADQTTEYPGQIISNFSQKVDHFDPLDTRKWNQRMFYNPIHADRSIAGGQDLVFLMIGGEGREGSKWSGDDSVMIMQFASMFGATVFDLEHRFFGDSRPINDMKTSSLRLLTTQQALADLAYFITVMNKEHGFENPKWITFGGSYPGSLSAMFRSKYPELTAGAVASSAPLNLALDFYEYADVVESVLSQTPIQNEKNASCPDLVRDAFSRMLQLSQTTVGRAQLNEKLKLSPPFDDTTTKADINNLFANLYDAHQGMIQYTYDGANNSTKTYTTAEQVCRIYNQDKDALDNVWDLLAWYNEYWNGVSISAFPNKYADTIKELAETDYDVLGDGGSSARGWMWLCCNEIGFLQTTDGDSIFGSTLPINYFYDMCTDMFGAGVSAAFTRDHNRAAQKYYGGVDSFDATNLCLPNGKYDPWSALGYYKEDKERNIVPVIIEGAAHCSDMYTSYEGEPAALPEARLKVQTFLESIIYDDEHPKKSASLLSLSLSIFIIFCLKFIN